MKPKLVARIVRLYEQDYSLGEILNEIRWRGKALNNLTRILRREGFVVPYTINMPRDYTRNLCDMRRSEIEIIIVKD